MLNAYSESNDMFKCLSRSDTVTQPCTGMRKAIAEAPVGDDVFRDDPTVLLLEQRVRHSFPRNIKLVI